MCILIIRHYAYKRTKASPKPERPLCVLCFSLLCLVVALAEDAEQIEEEVDEVEVELQGTEQGNLLRTLAHVGLHGQSLLDALAVPGGETHEEQHADVAQYQVKARAAQEHVDHRGDDEADESHEQDVADLGQVGLRDIAVEGHRAECAGGDEEYLSDARHGVDEEDARQRHAVQRRVDDEEGCGRRQRQFVDACRGVEHQTELGNEQYPDGSTAAIQGGEEMGTAGHAKGAHTRDDQGQCHPNIYLAHQGGEGGRECTLALTDDLFQILYFHCFLSFKCESFCFYCKYIAFHSQKQEMCQE